MADLAQALLADLRAATADQVLDHLIKLRRMKIALEAADAYALDRLDELADAGEIDYGGFKHAGWSFSHSDGQTSYKYPEPITQLEEQISAAKEAAKANGTAVKVKGKNAFWTVTPPNKP
jgi:hypothetical protein